MFSTLLPQNADFLLEEDFGDNLVGNTFEGVISGVENVEEYIEDIWKNETPKEDYSLQLVTDPLASSGNNDLVARFQLNRDDEWVSGSIRSELSSIGVKIESEVWYSFKLLIPDNWEFDSLPEVFAQWHNFPDEGPEKTANVGGPPLTMYIEGDKFRIVNRSDPSKVTTQDSPTKRSEDVWIGEYETGQWIDWTIRVNWSYEDDGILQIWKDGQLIVDQVGPNTFNDERWPYMKVGIYKWIWKDPAWLDPEDYSKVDTRVLFFDDVAIKAEVAESEGTGNSGSDSEGTKSDGTGTKSDGTGTKSENPNSEGPTALEPIRVEAESMKLKTFKPEAIASASAQTVISLRGSKDFESGQASFQFSGTEGYYRIAICYYDEGDGVSELKASVNQRVLDQWFLNRPSDISWAGSKTLVQKTLADELWLKPGDIIKLNGTEDEKEHIRIDYVELTPLGSPDPMIGTRKGDRVVGTQSGNIIKALGGRDTILGKRGDDLLYGGGGADKLRGQADSDYLYGNNGNDRMVGGAGDDWLDGGNGKDIYRGGRGCDTFVLTPGRKYDVIRNFDVSCDRIAIGATNKFKHLDIVQDGQHTNLFFKNNLLAQFNRFEANALEKRHFILG
jgi:hypothetical protein